ncbi:hypothetical protein BDV36DRAFT_242744 [Aspergillus pseudocaelatus]|uniref:Secreted protein n=1 Tax=Aspergillus pseudocaelatus TaxID=1825620 RepID=A0ABQ6X2K0_9EURO|nr:hypothetical protein BDV36DRAFT_242744 [Aspergillus pseudocaelatus]
MLSAYATTWFWRLMMAWISAQPSDCSMFLWYKTGFKRENKQLFDWARELMSFSSKKSAMACSSSVGNLDTIVVNMRSTYMDGVPLNLVLLFMRGDSEAA